MSDYMAQKADDQIEAGLMEREKLLAENAELKAEVERLSDALGGLLCHATGSLLSYSTYPKQTMYDAVDDYIEQRIEQALERME